MNTQNPTPAADMAVEAVIDELMKLARALSMTEVDAHFLAPDVGTPGSDAYKAADAKFVIARDALESALRAALARPQEVAGVTAWFEANKPLIYPPSGYVDYFAVHIDGVAYTGKTYEQAISVALEKSNWLQESSYRAGAKAGYNMGITENQEGLAALLAAHHYPRPAHPLQAQDGAPVERRWTEYTPAGHGISVVDGGPLDSIPAAGVQGDAARLDWLIENGRIGFELEDGEAIATIAFETPADTLNDLRVAIDAARAQASDKGA
jgi:hypothetical protein